MKKIEQLSQPNVYWAYNALAVAFVTLVELKPPSWFATSLEQGSEI